MIDLSATALLLGTLTFLLCFWFVRRPRNLPPGPIWLPFIGTRLGPRQIHEAYLDMARKYGPVFSVRRGPFLCVVLNDQVSIRQCLVKLGEFTSDRFFPGKFKYSIPDPEKKASLAFSNGTPWTKLRTFTLPALRSFGFGKQSLVPPMNLEACYLAEEIRSFRGQPTDLAIMLGKATANIISQLLFGRRYEYDDEIYTRLIHAIEDIVTLIPETDPANIFESLIEKNIPRYEKYREAVNQCKHFFNALIKEHQDTFQKNNIRDFVDAFLHDEISNEFKMEYFWRILIDFFVGGMDTTTVTTSWGILYLALYPDVQIKVQEELDAVVGRGRQPVYQDRPNLPYCSAALTEVMRIQPILPISVSHMTSANITLGPYSIPKGAILVPSHCAVHHDPKEWRDPFTFNPDRFLSEDGKRFAKNDAWMPFGIGRRDCVGSQLAKMETFLLFTNLFQQFEFRLPADETYPSLRGELGITMNPKPFKVCAIER